MCCVWKAPSNGEVKNCLGGECTVCTKQVAGKSNKPTEFHIVLFPVLVHFETESYICSVHQFFLYCLQKVLSSRIVSARRQYKINYPPPHYGMYIHFDVQIIEIL